MEGRGREGKAGEGETHTCTDHQGWRGTYVCISKTKRLK